MYTYLARVCGSARARLEELHSLSKSLIVHHVDEHETQHNHLGMSYYRHCYRSQIDGTAVP